MLICVRYPWSLCTTTNLDPRIKWAARDAAPFASPPFFSQPALGQDQLFARVQSKCMHSEHVYESISAFSTSFDAGAFLSVLPSSNILIPTKTFYSTFAPLVAVRLFSPAVYHQYGLRPAQGSILSGLLASGLVTPPFGRSQTSHNLSSLLFDALITSA